MLFGEKCTLCGGKIDKNGICTECGLDNNKSERHYKVNQSSCDGQPMTHIHSESTDKEVSEKKEKPASQMTRRRNPAVQIPGKNRIFSNTGKRNGEIGAERAGMAKIVLLIVVLLVIVSVVLPLAGTILHSIQMQGDNGFFGNDIDTEDVEYDPYAYVTKEEPEGGESYTGQFTQGEYVVGVHIPEGTYTMTSDDGSFMSLSLEDNENGIYLYESVDEETSEVDDLRLFRDAVVSVSGEGYLILSADNAQTDQMWSVSNPLSEKVRIEGGQTVTAGTDFPEGVYDLKAMEGYGGPSVSIYDGEGNVLRNFYPWLYDMSETECTYKNMVLPAGAVIENSDEELTLELIPSEQISSEDYQEYYTY